MSLGANIADGKNIISIINLKKYKLCTYFGAEKNPSRNKVDFIVL